MKSISIITASLLAIVFLPGCQTTQQSAQPPSVSPEHYNFIKQELSPAGGTALRPKCWKYSEKHRGPCLIWTLSKEHDKDGAYETGMAIQLMIGVEEGTGKTPEQFCKDILKSKVESAKVIRRFPQTKVDILQREGIEVEEYITKKEKRGKYHLIYSLFWDENIVVVATSGAPADLWDQYNSTFKTMGEFVPFDMEKMAKQVEQGK